MIVPVLSGAEFDNGPFLLGGHFDLPFDGDMSRCFQIEPRQPLLYRNHPFSWNGQKGLVYLFQDFRKAGRVKQSNRRHGEKRGSHYLGCSLIQLVCGLVVIYPFPAYDAEGGNVSLIVLHCLLTPRSPRQGRANNGSLYTVLKTGTPTITGETF